MGNGDQCRGTAICVDDVLITPELARRSWRSPDYAAENRALTTLALEMAANPDGVLQRVAELAMELCHADSAGISVLEPGGTNEIFRWRAATGAFAALLHGTIARDATPCGIVLSRNEVLLFNEAEQFFPALRDVKPRIHESLLAPWHTNGKAVGTLWAISHTPERRFDAEDARLLQSLARFASAAHQMVSALEEAKTGREELEHCVEERLRMSEAQAQAIVTNLPGGAAFVVNHDLRYQMAEGEALRAAGLDAAAFVGRTLGEVLDPAQATAHASYYRQALAGASFEVEHSEHERIFLTRGAPLRDGAGRVLAALAVSIDVTEHRRAETALRASLAEKEELLKEIHHRVKNNLQVITSLINLQAAQVEDERVLALFDETRSRVQSIASIHELLYRSTAFSAIELVTYARQLTQDLVHFYGVQNRVEVRVEGNGATLELQRAVPAGLLLNELISNACKHAFPGRRRGEIAISLVKQNHGIIFAVADTGVGLPPGFDYRQASSLGLQLVRNLTRQLKGTITMRSGPGTTVEIRFPEKIPPEGDGEK